MANCITKEELLEVLHTIHFNSKVGVNFDKEKSLRFDITQLNPKDLIGFLKGNSTSISAIKDLVGKAFYKKIGFIQSKNIKSVSKFLDILSEPENAVQRSVGLQNVIDAIKGESDKAKNNNISTSRISSNGITPNIPIRRLAAVIGRKVMYQQGFRFKSTKENLRVPSQIEVMYSKVGLTVLKDLESTGAVTISKGSYINDFVEGDNYQPTVNISNEEKTSVGQVVNINIDSLVTDNDRYGKYNELYFSNNALAREMAYEYKKDGQKAPELDTIAGILSVTNKLTTASTIVEPSLSKPSDTDIDKMSDNDYSDVSPMLQEARKTIAKTGSKLSKGNHSFIKQLAEVYNESGIERGFNDWSLELVAGSTDALNNIFGLNDLKMSLEKKESQGGQNLSQSAPMEDLLVKYSDYLDTDGNPINLHFDYNFVRNARLHNMTTILNAQTSKFARHGLTTGEVTFDITSEEGIRVYKHMVSELEDESGFSVEDITTPGKNTDLDAYLEVYKDLFENESDLGVKVKFLDDVISENNQFKGQPTTLLSTLAAINDVRSGLETGSVTTEYATKSDAKASGGMITLMEALGTNPKVAKILKSMDVLNLDGDTKSLNDVYGILQQAINEFTKDSSGLSKVEQLKTGTLAQKNFGPVINALMESGIYDKNGKVDTRELSKDPTMTLIYGQGKKAATNTIAEGMANKLFVAMQKNGPGRKKAGKYLSTLLGKDGLNYKQILSDPTIYSETVDALKDGNLSPAVILYTTLNQEVANKLFKERNTILGDVFNVLTDIQKKKGEHIKLMPPSAVLNGIEFTKENLNKYGIPLEKIFDVAKDVKTKAGTVWEVATREERPTLTTLKANAVHAKDTFNIYSATNDAMTDIESSNGIIPVHDEIIADPVTGEAAQGHYIKRFKQMARDYDILDNALKTAELMDPANPGIPKLRTQIDAIITEKQNIIDTQFNDNTKSIFGQDVSQVPDPVINKKPDPDPDKKPVPKAETTEDTETTQKELGIEQAKKLKGAKPESTPFDGDIKSEDIITTVENDSTIKTKIEKILKDVYPDINLEYKALDSDIKGQADINAKTVLLDPSKMTEDTLPHEYAHHYIAMFRDTPIVQAAIKKWGSEENLVDAIGKQTVEQDGEVQGFWEALGKWLKDTFSTNFDENTKEELRNALTDSFLRNDNLGKSTSETPGVLYSRIDDSKGTFSKAETLISNRVTNLNDAVHSMLLSKVEAKAETVTKNTHKLLKEKFPLYVDVSNKIQGVYDGSTALQQLLQFTHLSKLNKKQHKNMIQSVSSKLHQDRTTRDNDIMTKIDDLTADFTKEQHKDLYNVINKVPLSDYFLYGYENTSTADIQARILELDESMSEKHLSYVNHFVSLYSDNKVVNSKYGYNLDHLISGSKKANEIKELIALKGLEKFGLDKFEMFQSNTELHDIIKDNAVALAMIHKDIGSGVSMRPDVKGSLVGEYYSKGLQKQIITENDIDKFGYTEGTGWRIITRPENGKVGLAVRTIDDSFYLEGAGIDLGTTSNDIKISSSLAKNLDLEANNIVQVGDNDFRKVLTSEEKTEMGIIRKPGHSLVHTTSHMIAAQEAGILRKEMLKDDIRIVIETNDSSNVEVLQTLIKDKDVDHHWFIKLGQGAKYVDLPADIKAKYKPIDTNLSNLDGFKNEVSLVRKDMAYWLIGDNTSFFNNNPKLQRASKVVKQLISGAKIGMAVANPTKLAKDTASNVAFLTTMGVPLSTQATEGKAIMAEMNTLGQLRTQIAKIRVKQVAYPKDTNLQTKYDNLIQRLEDHPLNGVVKRGFMNSLSSDIYNNNIDSLKGLQADINTGLEYMLNKKDGTPNLLNKFISDIANVTGDGTEVLKYVGNIVKKSESTEEMGRLLDGAAERIKKIKTQKDSVAYLNNFIISPNSEIVKAGVWYNDAIDTIAKETYYRYLTKSKNMDSKEAEVLVVESFPDYKENMPLAMKILSDYGVLMFPSYWARIHVPAYRMLTKRAVNTALGLELDSITEMHMETILDATLPVRLDSGVDIVHTPLDIIGINSIFPTELFK